MKTIIFVLTLICLTLAEFPRSVSRRQRHLSPSPRILGGNLTEPHSMPYQAFLEFYTETSGRYCGGSVISQNYVLTSAACANNTVEVLVTLGAHDIFLTESTQINVFSTDIIVHEHYGEDYGRLNDIAVVKLPKTIDYTFAIQPITLPKRADIDTVYIGVVGRVAGWAIDDGFISDKLFDILRYFDTTVLSSLDEACRDHNLPGTMFCTSGEFEGVYVSPCDGDTGGGFVVDGVLVGIVSYSVYCVESLPAFHTKVVNYLDWIGDNTDVVIE